MTTRSGTTQRIWPAIDDISRSDRKKPGDSSAGGKSKRKPEPQKIIAGFMNPACEHDWFKLPHDVQTLASEGKTIWRCRTCSEITNTYSWQSP